MSGPLRRRLPALPLPQYHRRDGAYLLCSVWVEVEPPCFHHLSLFFHVPASAAQRAIRRKGTSMEAGNAGRLRDYRQPTLARGAIFAISSRVFGQLVLLGCRRRRPCTCSLSTSSSPTALFGDLILELASCLDAFSTYPYRTLLPGSAPRRDNRLTGGSSNTVLSY